MKTECTSFIIRFLLAWFSYLPLNVAICDNGSISNFTNIDNQFSITENTLTVANGLSSNIITAIVKDHQGFMWFGTPSGLCRWDGFTAIVYQQDESDSLSLMDNRIPRNGLIYDRNNQSLIIGTNAGLSILELKNYKFTHFTINPKDKYALQSPVNNVFIDRQGVLWIGTDHGFARFRPEKIDFDNYHYSGNIPNDLILDPNAINQIFDIKQDVHNDSILWLATLAGLLKFDKVSRSLDWFYFPDKKYLRDMNLFTMIVPHPDGNLYLGTWNLDMVIFSTQTETFTGQIGPKATGTSKLSNRILPYLPKSENELWVSSLQGIGIMNTVTHKIDYIKAFKNEKGHRFAPEIFYMDNDYFWLGSEYGVFILNASKITFSNYFFNPKDEDHWYLTNCIFEDPHSNELFIGYGRGEGLHFFDRDQKKFSIVPYPRRSINEYNLISLLMADSLTIFALSSDDMYRFSRKDKKLISLNCSLNSFPAFTDMKMDAQGTIWVASSNIGLQKYNPNNNSLETVKDWSSFFETGHALPLFQEICIDSENRIWFRRRGESYGYCDPMSDSVHYFNQEGKVYDLTSFSETVNDTIWVAAANKGLGFIETKKPDKGVQLIFSSEVLKSGIIHDVVVDQKNRIWYLCEKGLVKLDKNSGKSILFDESYGVAIHDSWSNKNSLIPGKLAVLSDGSMVIGYRRGLGFFHPDSLKVLYHPPEPYIISIKVFDEDIQLDTDKVLKLNHDQNHISFNYSALDLYNSEIKFRHKLSGVDKNWIENVGLHEATYSNLSPGNYTLRVESVSKSGFGDKKELLFEFKIRPPWWKTAWAILVFVLIGTSILYLFYRFLLKRKLQQRETQRLKELDELKTRLYANITHEFRTPITVIMGMAEELADSLGEEEKQPFLKKLKTIERNSGNLLHLVNQMLDLAKLEHGKLNYKPIQTNIIPWFQYIVESHQSLAEAKKIQLTFYTETESLIMDYDPDQLSKVISNLLTNAIKFSDKQGKVICHVKEDSSSNQLCFKIKDDGIGIPDSEQSRIFDRFYQVDTPEKRNKSGTGIGLSLTREIVEMIGGSISVKSQPGKGTEFEVVIPVTRNASLKPSDQETFEKPFIKKDIPDQPEGMEMDEPKTGSEKPLVLIAEDNQDIAGYIRDTIRLHYRVKWASDGEKALALAFDLIPDIVISDVMMPGKDGFEVCNTLKQDIRTDHIPVILLTAKVTDTDRISGYEHGADAYLTKPFNKKELLVRLDQLLKLRRQLQSKFGKLELRKESNKPLSIEEQFIRKAALIVEKNMDTSMFNAADLAKEVHLSESQLYRKLKAISGKSTAIFIRGVRLNKAHELLDSSTLSISEIAYQVGFNDPAWFSRVFKEEFGVSPTEARVK